MAVIRKQRWLRLRQCEPPDVGGYTTTPACQRYRLLHITMQDRNPKVWRQIYRLIVTGAQFKERFGKFILGYKTKIRPGYRSRII